MNAISYDFCDWVIEQIKQNLGGKLTADNVFDMRKRDLGQSIKLAVNKGLGACVVVELGGISPQGDKPDDTQLEIEVNVAVCHNAAMKSSSAFDSRAFAENLYRVFAGASFQQRPGMPNNVRAGKLTSQGEDKMLHMFNINLITTI
jgi:hypothetical protein